MLFDQHEPHLGWLLCFFFNMHSNFVVVINIAVFVDLPSSLFGKHFFFICSICNTNSFFIKTTDLHLINTLIMLLIWLIVVLLLLQTTHYRHRVFYHDLSRRKTDGAKCMQLSAQLVNLLALAAKLWNAQTEI